MSGMGTSFMGMLGGLPNFSAGPKDSEEKDETGKPKNIPERDPNEITNTLGEGLYSTRDTEQWSEIGMLDGFNPFEQEKLTNLYNEIIDHSYLWKDEYKQYYLLAVNYAFKILKASDEVQPSAKERIQVEMEAKKFINDMNMILDGVLATMEKYLPNANPGFGIMCLFSHSYVGELIAMEVAIEQMKSEIV